MAEMTPNSRIFVAGHRGLVLSSLLADFTPHRAETAPA